MSEKVRRILGVRVPGLLSVAAAVVERIAMEAVGAGLGDDVHHSACILPILRSVVAGLNAEFLERIGKGKGLIDVGVLIYIVTAVELVTHHILARAVGRNSNRSRKRLGEALIGATVGRGDRTRRQ